jgi:hypothetical protein
MGKATQFAVLQREPPGPTPDQWKRAFKSFSHLTDADAVRLAAGAHGILMKHLRQDAARALQSAFQAEGIRVAIVAENDLPRLPEARSLRRLELWPQALSVYDPVGRATLIPWRHITLVTAGAAQHVVLNKTHTEFTRRQLDAVSGTHLKKTTDAGPRIEPDSQLLLELIVGHGASRHEIDASQFTFKHVIDRPGIATEEKFIWLVREICREATRAVLNSGARSLLEGRISVPTYTNRQVLTDEIVWLLWWSQQHPRPD